MDSVGDKAMYQDAMTKTRMERGKGFQCQSGGASGLCPQPAAFRSCAGGVVCRLESSEWACLRNCLMRMILLLQKQFKELLLGKSRK